MPYSRARPLIAIKNDSTLLTDLEVVSLIPALQRQVTEHFEPAWGLGAQLIFAEGRVPKHTFRITIYDEATDAEDAGFIGYHFSPEGYPMASVFAKEDMKNGVISDTLSHEILEMLVDPGCNLYAHRPSGRGHAARGYFYEVCDPVQSRKYEIDGHPVCDFVYPEWFEHVWGERQRQFDHLDELKEPFQLLDGCYADVYERKPGQRGRFRTIWGPETDDDAENERRARPRKGHRKNQRINIRGEED